MTDDFRSLRGTRPRGVLDGRRYRRPEAARPRSATVETIRAWLGGRALEIGSPIKLIDALPTRFMVGTDTYNPNVNFEQNIAEIRKGLLARLQPISIELVAYKNAVRVMRLD